MNGTMMRTGTRAVAVTILIALIAASVPLDGATQRKKKKKTPRKVTAPAVPRAVGTTLDERLDSLVNSKVSVSSTASIQVVEVESGRVVAERNPALPVSPASNIKLFTTAASLDLIGSAFAFVTTVSIRGEVSAQGTLHGDVRIIGRGDPTLGGRFHDGRAAAVMEGWADDLKRQGISTIAGDVVFEHGYFDDQWVHPTWPVNQLTNWYEAPIAALSAQEGCTLVRVYPTESGKRSIVRLEPPNSHMTIRNSCITRAGRNIFIARTPGTNQIVVDGSIPPRSGAWDVYVTVMEPVGYFASVTRSAFERKGLEVLGQSVLVEADSRTDWRVVSEHRTPLAVVNYVINKKSQNHYAEQLLKTIGAEVSGHGSWESGSAAVTRWLTTKVGVPAAEFKQVDGSGMSRFNKTSANAFVSLLRYMWSSPNRREFVSSMPFTGEPDSRLKHRLATAPYARSVYAKTGYISGVIGLSGYVHAQSGKMYAFSFLFNDYQSPVYVIYRLQEEMLKEIVDNG